MFAKIIPSGGEKLALKVENCLSAPVLSEEDLKCNEEELTKTKAVRSEKLALNQQPTAQLGGGGAKMAISMGGEN
ncbi:unnamed protein product [Haemonchus placei]|uniref:Uncharacterized protein n=1 Tax=Haemonchus placei TaxID=6290 RepID=A0A0N4WBS8_HAEPC|nr:unnamed protein product [Haemonchus placei]